MTYRGWINLLLVISCAALALWWMRPPSPELPSTGAPAALPSAEPAALAPVAAAPPPADAPAVETAPAPAPDAPAPEAVTPVPWPDDVPPEKVAMIETNPTLRERARQHLLAAEADARWEQAVASGQYSADDFDPAVRQLFAGVELEPQYAEGGRIDGLWLGALDATNPLAQAGFREGDLLDSLAGTPLRDPGDLPGLLARLGPRFDVCAVRDGATLCRELLLE
jgi:hypothetical protein